MTDKPSLLPVYLVARKLIDFMDQHDGACRGDLIQELRNALVDTDELLIPEFLRRSPKPPAVASSDGLEDLL